MSTTNGRVRHPAHADFGERLVAVLDAVADGVTVQAADGQVVYANAAAARLTGFASASDLVAAGGAAALDRYELLDPSGRPLSLADLPGRRALAGESQPEMIIGFRSTADGRIRWASVEAKAMLDPNGRIEYVINTFRDITAGTAIEAELRASEERYRQVVEALPQIAWMTTADGRIVFANRRWSDYFGPGVPVDTEALIERVHPDDVDEVRGTSTAALAAGDDFETACRLRRHDGAYRWHLLRGSPLASGGPTADGWILTSTDVDDEARAREAAEAALRRIDRLQRATRAIANAETRIDVVNLLLHEVIAAVGASGGSIVLQDADGGLRIASAAGLREADVARWERMPIDADIPLAQAVRTGQPLWMPDLASVATADPTLAAALAASPNRSACVVPIVIDSTPIGAFGLVFATARQFDDEDRRHVVAYADLAGQALDRVALNEARDTLLGGLEEQRERLEAVLRQMPAGVIIATAPDGLIRLMNGEVERVWRGTSDGPADPEAVGRSLGFAGGVVAPDSALGRALRTGEVVVDEEIEIARADGSPGWVLANAAPIRDRHGAIVAGVVTFTDITERRRRQEDQRFLIDASEVLYSSLDYTAALRRVAELAVPRIAEWCVVDLLEDGALRRIAAAHADPARREMASRISERYPPAPSATAGPAQVIHTGRPVLLPDLSPDALAEVARDPAHRHELETLGLRSALSVPLRAGDRVLGAITFVEGPTGRRYTTDDLALAEDLAGRAAAAIERTRLFRDVGRFKQILDASLDAVFMVDVKRAAIEYANEGAVRQLGRDRDSLLRLTLFDLVSDADGGHLAQVVARLADGSIESQTLTLSHRRTDGRVVPVDMLLQHVALPGERPRIVTIARDVTERVQSQIRLQRLAEAEHARAAELNAVIRALGDGVIVCGPDGTTLLANPAAAEIFPGAATESYEDILVRLEDPAGAAPPLGARGGPVELRVRGDDARWIELSTYPVGARSHDGRSGRPETIVLLRDVTEARRRSLVRDTFLGVLSHELRTPITTIFAASEVLGRPDSGLAESTRREIFADIRVEAERLHRIVEDVIAMTRFGEGEAEVGNEPVLLQRILPSVVRSEEARWPGVAFDLHMPIGLPTVTADPTYVEQVVRNLLSNAAKYGGPDTHVEVVAEHEADEVVVRITDDGPGFPADEAERLFDRFYRSPRTATAAGGAGIGLFVCARLIRAMGGRIWAGPRPGRGAVFAFSLRVMRED